MNLQKTKFPGILILNPVVFDDYRGFFMESYNKMEFERIGIPDQFVQDDHTKSNQGVVRGLHFQKKFPQGKIVRCIQGEVLDVVVDIRIGSPTFGQTLKKIISSDNKKQLWIPHGFAHGFSVLSQTAELLYKLTDYYHPEDEEGIRWDDPSLKIDWKIKNPIVSEKDQINPYFEEASKNFPKFMD